MDRGFDWGPLLEGGPLFIGILNLTPDSFSDGGHFLRPEAALAQARALVRQGCRMLDLGAESTRPGAAAVSPEEEWRRLEGPLGLLRTHFPHLPLSLDTRHGAVASLGLGAGVTVLNDVTGFADPRLLDLARSSGCGLIAMRSRRQGDGFLMPPYLEGGEPTPARALGELAEVRDRLQGAGIPACRILLDPGFGFGTTFSEDLALWESMADWPRHLEWPGDRFCLGISRKRFLAHRAGSPDLPPSERDPLTAQAHREALERGIRVFRTHTVG